MVSMYWKKNSEVVQVLDQWKHYSEKETGQKRRPSKASPTEKEQEKTYSAEQELEKMLLQSTDNQVFQFLKSI